MLNKLEFVLVIFTVAFIDIGMGSTLTDKLSYAMIQCKAASVNYTQPDSAFNGCTDYTLVDTCANEIYNALASAAETAACEKYLCTTDSCQAFFTFSSLPSFTNKCFANKTATQVDFQYCTTAPTTTTAATTTAATTASPCQGFRFTIDILLLITALLVAKLGLL